MFEIELKIKLKKGDPDAFKEVFRTLYPRMKGYCRLFIQDEHMVEDIIQNCFLKLWEKRSNIQPEKSIESYIFTILKNLCLNILEDQRFSQEFIELEKAKINEFQFLYQLDFTGKKEKSLEEMMIESMKQAIDELPGNIKEVFIKSKIEGKRQMEVASELGISIKTVEKYISKAKKIIREKLISMYPSLAFIIIIILD